MSGLKDTEKGTFLDNGTLCHKLTLYSAANLLLPYTQAILDISQRAMADPEKTDPTPRLVFGLIGDLASAFPDGRLKQSLLVEWIGTELRAKGRYNGSTKQVQRWAREVSGRLYATRTISHLALYSNTRLLRPKLDSCCVVHLVSSLTRVSLFFTVICSPRCVTSSNAPSRLHRL